ncbi:hypothetical protein Bbelb_363130 [Branchiostoma belcheri]|nr:hypothetical protein Bbelb_363130 [Branchiostoma belcheri]
MEQVQQVTISNSLRRHDGMTLFVGNKEKVKLSPASCHWRYWGVERETPGMAGCGMCEENVWGGGDVYNCADVISALLSSPVTACIVSLVPKCDSSVCNRANDRGQVKPLLTESGGPYKGAALWCFHAGIALPCLLLGYSVASCRPTSGEVQQVCPAEKTHLSRLVRDVV